MYSTWRVSDKVGGGKERNVSDLFKQISAAPDPCRTLLPRRPTLSQSPFTDFLPWDEKEQEGSEMIFLRHWGRFLTIDPPVVQDVDLSMFLSKTRGAIQYSLKMS